MAWIHRFKIHRLDGMKARTDESGIALFMVIAAMTVLSVVVTEFTYVAQVNSRSTVDSSDQQKAHYLAKTGFKISLLRLRAYKELKALGKDGGTSGLPQIPKQILDQIWGFPFFYPIPGNAPGLTVVMKDEIEKFQSESDLPGHFVATIESESDKIGINSVVSAMAPPAPVPSRAPGGKDANPAPTPSSSATPKKYSSEEARKGLKDFLFKLVEDKFKKDQDFAAEYRDVEVEELYNNILGWVDPSFQAPNASGKQAYYKRAPFYSMSELRLIHPMDDGLYNLIAPNFTPFVTPGVNVNKMKEPMLRVLLAGITDEEVETFFKDRDSAEVDGTFKTPEDFFKYVEKSVGAFKSSTTLEELKTRLTQQGIQILVDEEIFKITVTAEVNKATRILEAWLILEPPPAKGKKKAPSQSQPPARGGDPGTDPNGENTATEPPNAAGLRILLMRES